MRTANHNQSAAGMKGRLALAGAVIAASDAAIGGLYLDVYRDNDFTTAGWWGTDLATLVVIAPVAALAIVRRSARARLVRIGVASTLLYNAAFYAFGARMNVLFLAYLVTMALAVAAVVLELTYLDATRLEAAYPKRGVAAFFLLVGAGLATVEIGQVVVFMLDGTLPDVVVNTGHPTHVVAVLDLMLVIPVLVLAGILLIRRNVWGYVLGIAVAVKGALYTTGLSIGTALVTDAGHQDALAQLPIWAGIGIGSAIAATVLLTNVTARPPATVALTSRTAA